MSSTKFLFHIFDGRSQYFHFVAINLENAARRLADTLQMPCAYKRTQFHFYLFSVPHSVLNQRCETAIKGLTWWICPESRLWPFLGGFFWASLTMLRGSFIDAFKQLVRIVSIGFASLDHIRFVVVGSRGSLRIPKSLLFSNFRALEGRWILFYTWWSWTGWSEVRRDLEHLVTEKSFNIW